MAYYQNPATKSKGKGDFNIREGIEISPDESFAVVQAVTISAVSQCARTGHGPSFEEMKKLVSAARFAASCAQRQIDYVNSKVRESKDYQQGRGKYDSDAAAARVAAGYAQSKNDATPDYDDDIGF